MTTTSSTGPPDLVFHGCVVQTPSLGRLTIEHATTIVVCGITGRIIAVYKRCDGETTGLRTRAVESARASGTLRVLGSHEFLLPGFVDCHLHAPQYSYTGTGLDLPLNLLDFDVVLECCAKVSGHSGASVTALFVAFAARRKLTVSLCFMWLVALLN